MENKPTKKFTFEELVEKSNRCLICAMHSESDWAYWYWQKNAEALKDKAFQTPIERYF